MKTNEITEGNQLIAEFMGITDDKGWYDGFLLDKAGLPFSCGAMGNGTRQLNFNSSWDWLMPVVERIEKIGYYFFISDLKIEYANKQEYPKISQNFFVPGNKLYATWTAVIEFIKWYNENK